MIGFVNSGGNGVEFQNFEIFQYNMSLFSPGTKLKITVEHYHPQRSLKQSAVLHWYCAKLAEECGMEAKDFKMMMKMRYLVRPVTGKDGEFLVDPESGEVMTYIPSTADLDTMEMMEFTDKVRIFGEEFLKYSLPLPDENYKIHFLEHDKKRLQDGSTT